MKKRIKLPVICLFILCLFAKPTAGQDSLGLQECIAYAIEHSIVLQQSQLNSQSWHYNYQRSLASAFPSLNGFAAQNNNFGRTVDPFSNQFVNQQVRSASFSLSSDVTLFQGLQRLNEIRQSKWAEKASEFNVQKTKDDVALTIANYYLQILLARERLKQVEEQLASDTSLLRQTQILYEAGAAAQAKLAQIKAQVATDKALLVDTRNQLLQAELALKQFMNYDITAPLHIKYVSFSNELLRKQYDDAALTAALGSGIELLPAIKQVVSEYMSAKYSLQSTRGTLWPRISASASLNSVYSNLAQQYNFSQAGYEPIGFLATDSIPVLAPKFVSTGEPINFNEQLRNNFGQSYGFSLSIPLFNGLQSRAAVQNAKIDLALSDLAQQDARNQAKNDIYQSYENMNMAFAKLQAAQAKLDAQEELQKQAELQFNEGLMNYFDFYTARTSYNTAQSELLVAKYEYIFQKQVFEYYLGKPIQFRNE